MTADTGINKMEYKICESVNELESYANVKMPTFDSIKPTPIITPFILFRTARIGSVINQHKNLVPNLPADSVIPTYTVYADQDFRYHVFNIKGKGRANEMLKDFKENSKGYTDPWLIRESEITKMFEGVQEKPTTHLIEVEKMPKVNGKIPLTCHKCKHTTMVSPTTDRPRCAGKDTTKKSGICMTNLVKQMNAYKEGQNIARPEKVKPTPEVKPDTVEPVDPAKVVNGLPTIEPEIEVTPPQIIPEPEPKPPEPITQPQAIPVGVTPPVVIPGSQTMEVLSTMFTVEELKELVNPLHTIEMQFVNQKMGTTIMNEPMVKSMDKSLAVILFKVQEMFPDKAFIIGLATYAITQLTILGQVAMQMRKEKESPQAPPNTPKKTGKKGGK